MHGLTARAFTVLYGMHVMTQRMTLSTSHFKSLTTVVGPRLYQLATTHHRRRATPLYAYTPELNEPLAWGHSHAREYHAMLR
jgi:hypothetical protein